MEIVYAVDLKISHDRAQLKDFLAMDISCLNILAFSCPYLSISHSLKYNPHLQSLTLSPMDRSSFCLYICALEQPWYCCLITTSIVPFVQLVWSLDGTHLLICNARGLCQVFQMKNGCINTMENLYQYQINEDILYAKYIFPMESIVVNLDQNESIFYEKANHQSPWLQYALHSGNFLCVTTSGTIHTLPIKRSLSPFSYSLSQNEAICASLCDIHPFDKGLNIILGEDIPGALIQFFIVHYTAIEPRISYSSSRAPAFRIPSCYGTVQSLKYFQRNKTDCILTCTHSFSGDLIDLYEYNLEQKEWISITLLNSSQARITSISLSPNRLLIDDHQYQGLFAREILVTLNNGSIISFDKFDLKCRAQCFLINQTESFVQIKHTFSGSACLGLTENGLLIFLRTITLNQICSLPSIVNILVHLFEQYIVQIPCPCDLWDILCLIPRNSIILNDLIDRLVMNFQVQTLEFQRIYFIRYKECLHQLHRLACPMNNESSEHLTSLLVYHILLIVRDYLRLFIYEPTNRNFVDAAQEILHQSSFMQNIDLKRIKYLADPSVNIDQYQCPSFTRLIDWITDLLFYLIGYFQSRKLSRLVRCKNLFTDYNQLQWLRELIIYAYILHQMNGIPMCKLANLKFRQIESVNKDILKDIYHSLTKFTQRIQGNNTNIFAENYLEEFSVLDIEILQSTTDNLFPQFYRFLLPNCSSPQIFLRNQSPFYDNSETFENFSDIQFDIITLEKISLSSTPTFRRCLRCSNFSTESFSFLVIRLNNRCLCGGLFLQYTQ